MLFHSPTLKVTFSEAAMPTSTYGCVVKSASSSCRMPRKKYSDGKSAPTSTVTLFGAGAADWAAEPKAARRASAEITPAAGRLVAASCARTGPDITAVITTPSTMCLIDSPPAVTGHRLPCREPHLREEQERIQRRKRLPIRESAKTHR